MWRRAGQEAAQPLPGGHGSRVRSRQSQTVHLARFGFGRGLQEGHAEHPFRLTGRDARRVGHAGSVHFGADCRCRGGAAYAGSRRTSRVH